MSARVYTAHLPRGADPVATLLVDDRWRWGAFLFPLLWALWSRHWLLAVALLALAAGTGALAALGATEVAGAVEIGIRAALALEGAAAIRLDRRLRGWLTLGAVGARDDQEAERLWFSRRLAAREGEGAAPRRAVPRAGGGPRPRLEPGLGDPGPAPGPPPRRADPPLGGGAPARASEPEAEPSFWSAPPIAADDRAAGAAPPPLIPDRRGRPT